MKISYNWLKEYIKLDMDAQQLSILLTDCGLEVESVEFHESIKGGLKGVKVGQVITCERHPNADKLSVTTVDIGSSEAIPVVCGAANVAKGQKVLVATVGTQLLIHGEKVEIKKSKIRGETSEGMICAEDELQLGESHDGIMVLDAAAQIGAEASQYFPVNSDYVFEIGLTPNRADATSHFGVARDIVAVVNRFYPEKKLYVLKPELHDFKIDNQHLEIDIEIKNEEACPRYSGICIENIQVKESPEWLKNRLKSVGIRPINNVVDVTNFVLMETGQPLHSFDYDQITEKKIIVQTLAEGSKFVTLDEVERSLGDQDLMICNAKEPMCIAGVFGGLKSGVKPTTVNLFIESAYFNPVFVRKTSKKHNLKTDASFRFERGADPNITIYALQRAAMLIKEVAGGNIASAIKDVYPNPINNWTVDLHFDKLNTLIGQVIERPLVKSILTDLDLIILAEEADFLHLEIPTFKVDVTREVDVIEEVLRIYGYNHIQFDEHIHSSINHRVKPDKEQIQQLISEFLVAKGFNETMNNSLTKASYFEGKEQYQAAKSVGILNPLSSELNVLRQSLVFGGLETILRNINFKSFDLKLFEFGKHYQLIKPAETSVDKKYHESEHLAIFISGKNQFENWKTAAHEVDFYALKEIANQLFTRFGIPTESIKMSEATSTELSFGLNYSVNQKHIASLGKLSKAMTKEFDIQQEVYYLDLHFDQFLNILKQFKTKYTELPKFPSVRRDLALLVNQAISYEQIEGIAYKAEKSLLKSVNLFDVYEGTGIPEGKKSYAVSLIFQDETKTLTDKIIDKTVNKMVYLMEQELDAKLR